MADDLHNKKEETRTRRKYFQRIYWIPVSVFALSLVSISLLMLTGQISERHHQDYGVNDALLTMRLQSAAFHLWLEEALFGDEEVDIQKVWLHIDRAIHLSEVILNGGRYENHMILEPLRDSKLRAEAERIKSLLTEFKAIAVQRYGDPKVAGIGSFLDQKFDDVHKEFEDKAKVLEDFFDREQNSHQTRSNRLFLVILFIWVSISAAATAGLWSRERRRKRAEEALQTANEQLQSQTEELKTFREHLMDLVEKRTMELITINKQLEEEIVDHQRAEIALRESTKQVQYLCSQLLTIQEKERSRISKELHDELGGGMATLKLWVNFIKRKLREDQTDLTEECERTGRYIDRIIEDVHRLSWDLSPSVLQDLGLSKALQWLVKNLVQHSNIKVTLDIEDSDFLLSPDVQTTVYRIFQEALTNAVKHAQAKNISVAIKKNTDEISFSIVDDGKGFDLMNGPSKNGADGGLGLRAMHDRAQMLGGSLKIWSQEGKGTGIELQIPIEKNTGITE